MATSKITKLEIKEGKTEAFIAFENKAWGIYEFTDTCDVSVGDTVEFEVEKKTFDSGKSMNFIRIKGVLGSQPPNEETARNSTPTPQPTSGLYTSAPKSYNEMKSDLRGDLIAMLGTLAVAGKIEPKEIVEWFNDLYPAIDLSIDVLSK